MRRQTRMLESSRAQRGVGLVEIMIAIAISAVLLTGVIQIFLSSKQTYRVVEATSRMQENGRFAVQFLSEDLRMAGYSGCYQGDTGGIETILNDPNNYNWDLSTPLEGNEWNGAGWTPALDPLIAGQVLNGTDVVTTRGLASDGIGLVSPYSDSAQLFIDPAADNINDGDIMMVTDCKNASMFQTTNQQAAGGKINIVHSSAGGWTPGNSTPLMSNSYGADAELARFESNVYYIGTGASGEPALFRQRLITGGVMQAQELIDGVENMQILYGEDTDSDDVANRYVSVDNVTDMANVSSVRISLLLRTGDNIASQAQTYTYDGQTTTAGDLRMRRVFTSTIKLRNRGLL